MRPDKLGRTSLNPKSSSQAFDDVDVFHAVHIAVANEHPASRLRTRQVLTDLLRPDSLHEPRATSTLDRRYHCDAWNRSYVRSLSRRFAGGCKITTRFPIIGVPLGL